MKIKKLFKKPRILLLIVFIIFAILAINPGFTKGVAIKHVAFNSTAYIAGMRSPEEATSLRDLEVILYINGQKINSIEDYARVITSLPINSSIRIKTNKAEYAFLKTSNDIGLTVIKAPTSNIRKGLELAGGTRVLLKPKEKITEQERQQLVDVLENRLNVFGLTDVKIKPADDLLGNKYILVELAGATKEDVQELLGKQGKFEAKIGNITVFSGGKKDIVYVCRATEQQCFAGIRECLPTQDGRYYCKFEFGIKLSPEAAQRQASITKNLSVITTESGQQALEKKLDLYLDDKLVDSLLIMADLKGKAVQDIAISGPGYGTTKQEAMQNALKAMKKLQTILITGSLPVTLEITKLDTISPTLGEEFLRNALLIGFLALIGVALVIFLRYRNWKISLAMMINCAAELILLLGFAAFVKYNLDLAAIAGLIAAIGTGVDDQIVIADEILRKESFYSWKDRIKRAFFIIFGAYATTFAAMLPLFKAGAGLLTGFALITIVGISIGVFLTRPAFAAMLEVMLE